MSGNISLWLHIDGFMVVKREVCKFGDQTFDSIKGILFKGFQGEGWFHGRYFPALAHNFGWTEYDPSQELEAQVDDAEYFLWENLGTSVEDPGYFTEDSDWSKDVMNLNSHHVSCCLGIAFGYILGEYDEEFPSMDIVKRLQVLESAFMPYTAHNNVSSFLDIISKLRQDIHSNLS